MAECDPMACLHIECMREDIDELKKLVQDMWPYVLLGYPPVPSVMTELSEKKTELKRRMTNLGIGAE